MRKIISLILLVVLMFLGACNNGDKHSETYQTDTKPKATGNSYNWQSAYYEFFNSFDIESIKYLYIGDLNGNGIPEVMINNGILYYCNGEIKGEVGSAPSPGLIYSYLPETNQIIKSLSTPAGGIWIVTLYSYNLDTDDYEESDIYYRHRDGSVSRHCMDK